MNMELSDAIRNRHSVRAFQDRPVDEETLERLFWAAAMAPSSFNYQPWHFHVTRGALRSRINEIMGLTTVHLDEYIDALGQETLERAKRFYADLGGAPVVAAVSVPRTDDELARINNNLAAGAAVENMLLKAVEEGLATCNITFSFWVRDELAGLLGVPQDRKIIALVLIGYPAEKPVSPAHDPDCYTLLD